MSATLTVVCDKCGSTIVEGRTLAKISAGPLRQRRPTVDLCESCASSFESWLAEGNGQSDPVAGDGKPPARRGRKPREARA